MIRIIIIITVAVITYRFTSDKSFLHLYCKYTLDIFIYFKTIPSAKLMETIIVVVVKTANKA